MQTQAQLYHLTAFAMEMLRLCAWLFLLAAIFVPLERLWALHRRKVFRKGLARDLGYYFLSGFIPKLLLTFPMTLVAAGLHRWVPAEFYEWMASFPFWVRTGAALVVAELGAYWGHRWSHEIPFLWRFHAIHHSAEEIDWLVNTHAHPVDLFFVRFCGLVPIYALGLAQPSGSRFDWAPLLVTVVGVAWGFFVHANLTCRLGWLEWLVSSPAFHHWHHTNDGPALINKNYSAMLPWVDKVFGTFYLPRAEWPEKYGIDGEMPAGLAEQLARPLVGERAASGN